MKMARINTKYFAIVHIAAAQIELWDGNYYYKFSSVTDDTTLGGMSFYQNKMRIASLLRFSQCPMLPLAGSP